MKPYPTFFLIKFVKGLLNNMSYTYCVKVYIKWQPIWDPAYIFIHHDYILYIFVLLYIYIYMSAVALKQVFEEKNVIALINFSV